MNERHIRSDDDCDEYVWYDDDDDDDDDYELIELSIIEILKVAKF
jgi:hypothetical protein